MTNNNIHSSLAIFDYDNHKMCDLYDSQNDLSGQAYKISFKRNMSDGIKTLTFSIPYMIEEEKNFRWKYLKSEYLIRMIYKGKTEWYIAQKPEKHKTKGEIYGLVTCSGTEASLKTKNIYMQFDDENGIGTVSDLTDKILAGTGWHRGYTDPMLEEDGVTEKIRSISSGGKQGALGLMTTVCNLFKCYPVYKTDTKTVELYNYNNRDQVLEGTIGVNLNAIDVKYNSSDIITRLYVEGEYGDDGYIGIDSVNPTGLTYIMNFDYYREIGVFTSTHEAALSTYLTDIQSVTQRIRDNANRMTAKEGQINNLIGQCKLVLYYTSQGFVNPVAEYGDLSDTQKALAVGDKVVVLKNDGTFRYATIQTTPAALIQSGEYGIAKFATKAAGSIGAYEVQIEAKEKEIDNLDRKINATTKADKIAEYTSEKENLQSEINTIYTKFDGLYAQMNALMNQGGYLKQLAGYQSANVALRYEQDDIESDFIIAMGDMLRDGYWNNPNYIIGQEQHLYDDAVERMKVLSRPSVTYSFDLVRLHKDTGIPLEDFKLNALFRIHDDELEVHENLFITEITIGVDEEDSGSIEATNEDITINANSLGELLSRMSQLSDLIEQKNTLYNRAQAISRNKTLYVDRLNGQIDVVKNQILSSVSNWYTDDQGNILFESADGGSAMMLSGAGFMLASSKNDSGDWVWRTLGTGEGLTADEIVAGFISAERIEAGSIATSKIGIDDNNFGGSLVISNNPSITSLNAQIAPEFVENQAYSKGDMINHNGTCYVFTSDFAGGTFAEAYSHLSSTSIATQIELLPDQIIQYVGQKGYGHTYIQLTDPTLDPDKVVATGDYWIQREPSSSVWRDLKVKTWRNVKSNTWGTYAGFTRMFCWDGTKWIQIYDTATESVMFTRITQTQDAIKLEAQRANMAEGKLEAAITLTAEQITAEVQRATAAEGTLRSSIQVTAEAIEAEVTRAKGAEGTITTKLALDSNGKITLTSTNFSRLGSSSSEIYITPTSVAINSSGTFSVNSGGNMNIESGGNMNIKSGGSMTINSGGSMTISSGASAGVSGSMTINSGGSMTISSGSSMTINSGGNLTISSGGNFSLTSTYFNVATNGQITCTGGTIGGFTISSDKLYAGTGASYVQVATATWAFAAGNNDVGNAPFRVAPNGDVYIKSLKVRNEDDTGWDTIDFTSFATQEDVEGGFDKLKYNTVKSVAADGKSITLSNGKSYSIG